MLPPMTTLANPRLDELLSTRARIGWGASAPPARPVADAAFEFGGGHPDPSSFPYEGMVEATADVMKADGAAAFSYGEPQGYKGLRELVAHKYRLFENLEVSPDNVNWTTVFSTTAGVTGTSTWTFANATGRYVKWDSTVWFNSADRVKLVEFQLYQP